VPPAASFIENSPRQYLSFAEEAATRLLAWSEVPSSGHPAAASRVDTFLRSSPRDRIIDHSVDHLANLDGADDDRSC
jgi:hypothetical protein